MAAATAAGAQLWESYRSGQIDLWTDGATLADGTVLDPEITAGAIIDYFFATYPAAVTEIETRAQQGKYDGFTTSDGMVLAEDLVGEVVGMLGY